MKDILGVFGIWVLCVSVALLLLIPPIYVVRRLECVRAYSDYNPSFEFWAGCRIEYEGKKLPVDRAMQLLIKESE